MGKSETGKTSRQGIKGLTLHHIRYKEKDGYDWGVYVRKGEHRALTLLGIYTKKSIGKGVLIALAQFIADNLGRAVDLEKEL